MTIGKTQKNLNPCQLKHGCFGCCGHHFTGKKDVEEGIRKNNIEYKYYSGKNDRLGFLRREYNLRFCGICHNIGWKRGKLGCLVYSIKGKDMRSDIDCEIEHECKTFFAFKQWPKKKQLAFKKFVEDMDIDWYDFGVQMDNGILLEKFEKSQR